MIEIRPGAERLIGVLAKRALAAENLAAADWDHLLSFAILHDLAPVLYAELRERTLTAPPAVSETLHELYVISAARNVRLFYDLAKILRALRASGVPVIPLKGACLAEAVYGDIALRPMADLDLLVKPTDMPRALESVRALGYESDQPFDPATAQTRFQDMPPMSKPGGCLIELHWTLVTPLCNANFHDRELEALWSRATPATVAGVDVLMLSPADLLLHLCMHLSVHHRFNDVGLRSVLDISGVCRRYGDAIDWAAFASHANQWNVATGVSVALQLAQEWTDVPIPQSVPAMLVTERVDEVTMDWVRYKVLNGSPVALAGDASLLEGRTGIGGKLRTVLDAVFLSRDTMARLYPAPADSWRILTYYPVRLKDVWLRYRQTLWRIVRRDRALVADARKEARLREYLGWH